MLLALWSVAAWAFHAIAAWTIESSGALTGSTAALEGLRAPEWVALWVPPELSLALSSLASGFAPTVEALLAQAPGLAGVLSTLVWAGWSIGSMLLVILGVVGSGIIVSMRKAKLAWKP